MSPPSPSIQHPAPELAGIFDPYLDTLGGGERYAVTVAHCLAQKSWGVNIFWDDRKIQKKIRERFGLNLKGVNFVPNIFKKPLFRRYQVLKKYDLIFYISDGSIPFLFARNNILHFQIPFHGVNGRRLLNKIKSNKINEIVCNSQFTKRFIDEEYGIRSRVIYPPVAVEEFKAAEKENLILSVGRFSQLMQAKRQDVLIDGFKRMVKTDLSGSLKKWRLILAGGSDVGKDESFGWLKREAKGLPIEIIENPPFGKLKELYAKAKIFWLATGFGANERKDPEKVEHFGIATIEAMAAGCVPVVIAKGGQKEIVSEAQDGLLWKSKKELVEKTLLLIKERKLWQELSKAAHKKAQVFSQERFCHELEKIIR